MQGIVDRFEGEYVIIEIDGVNQDVPRDQVACGVKEGDAVELVDKVWVTNPKLTEERRQSIQKLMDDVWED
ncbi:DUF3006 domain-containing protein [Paenibacillus sp. N1-5-1-14]|uniref:DUF3006 domain-containing protein n=1 Tax=Paenibacillus radicibacter TaxID=2972488 RepID=UPI002159266F|nr:DUF3006 domain-containing protein [Paenibacillus radicibacter]MCR8645681.1 DUF3006 domain-containing protein [Paenibacillus radicibacter]